MIQAVLKSNLCLINWEWYKFHSNVFVVISLNHFLSFFFFNLLGFRCLLVSFTLQFILNSVLVPLAPLLSQLLSGQEPHGHLYPSKNHPQVLSKNRSLWFPGFFEVGGWAVKWASIPSKTLLKSEELKEVKWALCLCLALWSPGPGRLMDWWLIMARLGWIEDPTRIPGSRVLCGGSPFLESLPWGRHRAQVSLELLCAQGRAPRPSPELPVSLLLWFSSSSSWHIPHWTGKVCRQHWWNATNYPVNWLPFGSQHIF